MAGRRGLVASLELEAVFGNGLWAKQGLLSRPGSPYKARRYPERADGTSQSFIALFRALRHIRGLPTSSDMPAVTLEFDAM